MRNKRPSFLLMLLGNLLVMNLHRVEVLRPGSTPDFEFWSNDSGTIYVCRETNSQQWQAIVDGEVVVDTTHPWINEAFTHPVKPLATASASAMVPLLALQERIHVILEHGTPVHPLAAE